MTRSIRVDEEVFAELQRLAKEWDMEFQKPNLILRRALCLPPPDDTPSSDEKKEN